MQHFCYGRLNNCKPKQIEEHVIRCKTLLRLKDDATSIYQNEK